MRHLSLARRVLLSTVFTLGLVSSAQAQFYRQTDLVSDTGIVGTLVGGDQSLVNPWGLAASGSSPWWVANNATETSTLYNLSTGTLVKNPLIVSVPGKPTGIVFNPGSGFIVPGKTKALFLFATESGTILGWPGGTEAFVIPTPPGAVYKGLAFASTSGGDFIYATNFRGGTVDVFNSTFGLVPGGFSDPTIPAGYAPFGIQNLGGIIFVTYALQDEDKEDDVPGEGHGYVNAFDTTGHLLQRVASQGDLNSPWGLALAPDNFGKFSGDLIVGNFGDGRIHAFVPRSGAEFDDHGPLHSTHGRPIEIEGLWALAFGNGAGAGPKNTLFFTAGPDDESHGLFGALTVAGPPGHNK
jgi:uncharacterized protein (TIGR03118 family)